MGSDVGNDAGWRRGGEGGAINEDSGSLESSREMLMDDVQLAGHAGARRVPAGRADAARHSVTAPITRCDAPRCSRTPDTIGPATWPLAAQAPQEASGQGGSEVHGQKAKSRDIKNSGNLFQIGATQQVTY